MDLLLENKKIAKKNCLIGQGLHMEHIADIIFIEISIDMNRECACLLRLLNNNSVPRVSSYLGPGSPST